LINIHISHRAQVLGFTVQKPEAQHRSARKDGKHAKNNRAENGLGLAPGEQTQHDRHARPHEKKKA